MIHLLFIECKSELERKRTLFMAIIFLIKLVTIAFETKKEQIERVIKLKSFLKQLVDVFQND